MNPSEACFDLLKNYEGLRLTAYKDSVGIWTIGYGHTGDVKAGDVITQHQADVLLQNDAAEAARVMQSVVTVPLTQGMVDALTSFVFNVGMGAKGVKSGFHVLKSGQPSTLLSMLNRGDYAGARKQLLTWVYAGSTVLDGLKKRRTAEFGLFGDTKIDFSNVQAGSASTAPEAA